MDDHLASGHGATPYDPVKILHLPLNECYLVIQRRTDEEGVMQE
jgi:hypothetical protein